MKKLAVIISLAALSTGAYAQGVVIFANNPTTLVSANANYLQGDFSFAPITGPVGSYYFALSRRLYRMTDSLSPAFMPPTLLAAHFKFEISDFRF